MAIFSSPNVRLAGVSAAVPSKEMDNMAYSYISEADRKMLIKTTGIARRRVVEEGMTSSDLCFFAAEKLIKELDWDKSEIEVLLFVSQTPDYFLPSTAIILQNRLKLPLSTMAFDINLGCSGFTYGLSVIASLMNSAKIKKGLLLVGDTSSIGISPEDKSAYPLFGDAGAVAALELSNDSMMHFNMQSDGSGHEAIICRDGGARNFIDEHYDWTPKKHAEGIVRNGRSLELDGIEIFNFTLREVAPNIKALMSAVNQNLESIDFFVFHQANKLMNETIRRKLKIEKAKVPYCLDEFGNTSSASIPLTLVTRIQEELRNKKRTLLLSGFGVGLSWGSVVLRSDNLVIPELIEV